jgi:hypothetical protein
VKPLEQLITNSDGLPDRQTLKYSKTTQVFRTRLSFSSGPLDVICKLTKAKNPFRRLAGGIALTRERRNVGRAVRLLRAGIDTALPLALLERRGGPSEAWLVTEAIPEAVDLDQLALIHLPGLTPRAAGAVKGRLMPVIIDLLGRLETHRLHHRDLKASNLLITGWDSPEGKPRVWIVDLDGLGARMPFSRRARWQPLVRLTASLLGHTSITRTDYARFLKAYLRRTGIPADRWKQRFRTIQAKSKDYVRRARGRKRDKLDGYAGDG